jgi:hypothetical protein
MNLTLTRYGSIPGKGTFGVIVVDEIKFYTIEREWLDNQPRISCIPKGMYTLEPHASKRFGNTWALVNDGLGVYHYHDPRASRFAILFHVANKQKDLQGCIGLGLEMGGAWNVTHSRDATNHFLSLLDKEAEHVLEIR